MELIAVTGSPAPEERLPRLVSLAGRSNSYDQWQAPCGVWYRQYRGGGIHHRSISSAQAAQKSWHTANTWDKASGSGVITGISPVVSIGSKDTV